MNPKDLLLLAGMITGGSGGGGGGSGTPGTTFTPSVSEDGDISWTNDGGKTNPPTRNIKGPKGDTGNDGDVMTPSYNSTTGELSWTKQSNPDVPDPMNIRGPKGDTGDTGIGISSIAKTSTSGLVDTYTITLTDGSTYTFPVTNGEKGDTGDDGNGIASAVLNSDYTLTLTFTDGTSYTTGSIRGEKGETGVGVESLNPPEHASGSVVTFTSAVAGNPVNPLIVNIEPTQSGSGDPSPENIRPITGWTGANVMRTGKNLFSGFVMGKNINANTGAEQTNANTALSDYIRVTIRTEANDSYFLSGLGGETCLVAAYNAQKQFLGRTGNNPAETYTLRKNSFTSGTPSGSGDVAFVRVQSYKYDGIETAHVQLESGSTATAYEPFGDTYSISFGSAGTVYGGTLDVTRGLLTVTHMIEKVADRTWSKLSSGSDTFYSAGSLKKIGWSNVFCDRHPITGTGIICTGSNSTYGVYFRQTPYNSVEEFFDAEKDTTYCYERRIPITYQLTPQEVRTLLGINNLWADCGDVEATYRTGTEAPVMTADDVGVAGGLAAFDTVLDKSSIAPVETSYTASSNYNSGTFLIVGNILYKTTAAITSGETIIPDTNVVQTTIAEQLIALMNS